MDCFILIISSEAVFYFFKW